ncbi:molybdopterin-binding domain containing protein [Nitzschia inconspicua]|uniref:FAD synthase n=1 Tax=Nitzschia inconspicua TaxID=303405 RepID=A0A9K3LJT7_9STRA|nr:molybdopterin-binding domain containing protein [Nitzschia inconspicua]
MTSENNVPSLSHRSQSLMEDTPLTSSSPSNIPNWRTIPKDCDDYSSYLSQQRPTWSKEQFDASLQLYNDLMNCTDSYVSPAIQSALNTLDHAYRLYGPQSVVCSFNGGKDAVVILHLLRAAHAKYYNTTTTTTSTTTKNPTRPVRPRAVYFNNNDEFQEVVDFLHDSVQRYDLDMIAFEHGVSFSEGLQILVDNNVVLSTPLINNNNNNKDDDDDDNADVAPETATTTAITTFPMAFVLGTRSSDPNAAGQDHFSPSSHWMPPFMRVNPILRWNYGLVWHFLRLFQLPYCTLYDQGYTSLGTVKDTLPCPALAVNRGDISAGSNADNISQNLPQFWPAYMLRDWDQERAGRIKKKNSSSSNAGKDTKTAASAAATVSSVPPPAASSSSVSLSSSSSMTQSASGLTTVSNIRRVNVTSGGMYPANILPQQNNNNNNNNNSNSNRTEEDEDAYTVQSLGSDDCPNDGRAKRVGILIVGDEILKGMTIDTNTNVAAKALRKECVQLGRVAIVSDNVDEIAKEIGRMRNEVDVIITSGGVGPTHDDVTIQGVAQALERELVLHDEMADLLRKKMKKNQNNNTQDGTNGTNSTTIADDDDDDDISSSLTPAQVKMATLPSNAKLRYFSSQDDWPVLQCRNVFVLPGVPQFFEQKIERVAAYLSSQLERSVAYQVILSIDEAAIVDVLNQAVLDHPNVSFGSYPYVSHPEVKTVLTLEGNLVMEESGMMTNDNNNNSTRVTPNGSASRNSIMWDRDAVILPKAVRDQNVRLALDDLLRKLPEGSILRVENEDETPFT